MSAAFTPLFSGVAATQRGQAEVVLAAMTPEVLEVFRVTRMLDIVRHFPTVDEALAYFAAKTPSCRRGERERARKEAGEMRRVGMLMVVAAVMLAPLLAVNLLLLYPAWFSDEAARSRVSTLHLLFSAAIFPPLLRPGGHGVRRSDGAGEVVARLPPDRGRGRSGRLPPLRGGGLSTGLYHNPDFETLALLEVVAGVALVLSLGLPAVMFLQKVFFWAPPSEEEPNLKRREEG